MHPHETPTFDPIRSREHLVTRLSRLDPGIIRIASPHAGCDLRADYIAQVLAYVHAHLLAMLDDVRGNLNLDVLRLESELDQLNDIGDDIQSSIQNRIEQERL